MLFPTLFRHLKWNSGRDREGGSRRRHGPARQGGSPPRFVPRLETLEDRTVLSTLRVTSAADNGLAGTLRAVLAAAHSGDTILFDHRLKGQTITLTQGQLTVGQSVDIEGLGAAKLAISGNAASRVFAISAGATVTLARLTINDGLATDGAGILNGGDLTLSQDVLSGNVAQGVAGGGLFRDSGGRGGGVANQAGATLAVMHSLFAGNQALGGPGGGNAFGGGLYSEAGTVTIDQSVFIDNQAVAGDGGSVGVAATLPGGISATLMGVAAGGGVWNDGGSVTVTSSSLRDNLGQGGSNGDASGSTAMLPLVGTAVGGAIGSGAFFTTATPALAIAGSTLSGNQSLGGSNVVVGTPAFFTVGTDPGSGRGGAVGAVAGDVSVSNSTISGNLAEGGALFRVIQGGGVFLARGSAAFGGGIDHEFNLGFSPPPASPTLSITGSTISGNMALGNGPDTFIRGGGLATRLVNAEVTNSTMSGNQAIGSAGGVVSFSGRVFNLRGGSGIGGGIDSSQGSLTIRGSTVKDNLARGGPGGPTAASGSGGSGSSGGIFSSGQVLVLTSSTLSGNQAVGGDAANGGGFGGDATSGALFMTGSPRGRGSATISGTTFVNNLAQGGAGGVFGGSTTGGGATATFTSLRMTDCTFRGNEARAGAGGAGSIAGAGGLGGQAFTAGFHVSEGSSATISNTSFVRNLAQGGAGGAGDPGRPGGAGGRAVGGGMANVLAPTTLSNCRFVENVAQGGAGGTGGAGANGGAGGLGQGGAVWNVLAFGFTPPLVTSLTVRDSSIVHNQAVGGAGGAAGTGGIGGRGGNADGGGFTSSRLGLTGQVSLTLIGSFLQANAAVGGEGAEDGNGGNGRGGGLFIDADTTAALSDSSLDHNAARGGDGGNGGDGLGGGVYIGSGASVTVKGSSITHNRAEGGKGDGGSDGQGIGGGAYNLGTFFLDAASLIRHNRASTSNDDCFGC